MLDKESKVPLYSQLMDILIKEIEGKMQEGEKMPSEREICKIYDVSRTTARQTFQELEREGYIYIEHGKGAFVASKKLNQNLQGFYSFTDEMKKLGKVPSTQVVKFEIQTCNHEIAKKLRLEGEELVYKFTRLRLADGDKMILETTYVPYNSFPGITKEDLNKHPLYNIFIERFNTQVAYAEEYFTPVLTNEEECAQLGSVLSSPALKIVRYAYRENGDIIEYTNSIARGDKFSYHIMLMKK